MATSLRWLVLVLAACPAQERPVFNDPHKGQHRITFHNEGGRFACELYIFPFGQSQIGNNLLAPETDVASGDATDVWLPPNTYQVQVVGCTYDKQQVNGYVPDVIVNGPYQVVLYREDDARSKEAATKLAHDNENTTLIPAKIKFVAKPTPRPGQRASARGQR